MAQIYKDSRISKSSVAKNLKESLIVKQKDNEISVFLDDLLIVTYNPFSSELPGKIIDLAQDYNFEGFLSLNEDFFHKFHIEKHPKSKSDMKNIAKAFFQYNNLPHVCLVQYLPPHGTTNEHYHTLEEHIICLEAEKESYNAIVLRPFEDDTKKKIIGLEPGKVITIPPYFLHKIWGDVKGSITVPIKQTNPKKKDHFYQDRSEKRLIEDFDFLIWGPHYNSGIETIGALKHYYESCNDSEKKIVEKYANNRLKKEKNENIKFFLKEFFKDYS